MKPTVHDIAAHAGVSLATVDRVLNGRAGVRGPTRERVEAAIAALGYVRDVSAANLAKGRRYSFVFILPANDNSFMRALRHEVEEASRHLKPERITIGVITVPAFDSAALVAALDQAGAETPDGVALVAVDTPEVAAAVGRLRDQGIAVVTLVSDLSGHQRDHFAGIDNRAAGRTAASLLGRFVGKDHVGGKEQAGETVGGRIAVIAGSLQVVDHQERYAGFTEVMRRDFPHLTLLPVLQGRDDPAEVEKVVADLYAQGEELAGLYSLGAGNRGLVRCLRRHARQRRPAVIAHELTETTRAALEDGMIDAVLNQDAGHEVRSAIRVLKAKADKAPVIAAQERIRIDIFLKDNLP
ncbi:LacI family DNA-binding transcriptional regulator [Allorhizobium sp. BGMRC 0089]|uniref:LacI family DNA-binding transcriptional regulator n=1 Tax=Allorhizobium sonneratiae TaxID=2934936 RepID=UPI0020333A37|nr:LacI family DNA-binding transcriptional regulator [Allorhizobium sonneratiae]MCM2290790.1 LacI family DNA-binding transcriptional regulator [Allorhizobium sonneratiae]